MILLYGFVASICRCRGFSSALGKPHRYLPMDLDEFEERIRLLTKPVVTPPNRAHKSSPHSTRPV